MPQFRSISFPLTLILVASIAAAQAPVKPGQPATRPSRGVPEDFWEKYPRSKGEARWMQEPVNLAEIFQFSAEQKVRVLQFAREVDIGPCIEDSDAYFRRGLIPPDALSSTPGTSQCQWNAQTLREWVLSLVTPEQKAAHRGYYDFYSKEIAANRI